MIVGTLTSVGTVVGRLSGGSGVSAVITVPETITPEKYDGETEVTPTNAEQVLYTENKYLTENVVVKPIPQNYGLITWNGSVITVS